MKDFTAPVIDKYKTKPKHFERWGESKSSDFCDPDTEIILETSIRPLKLYIIQEKKGITFSCPDLELAMCGKNEQEAWENFIEAYKDLLSFLTEHEGELSEDLKRRLEIIEQPISLNIIRE